MSSKETPLPVVPVRVISGVTMPAPVWNLILDRGMEALLEVDSSMDSKVAGILASRVLRSTLPMIHEALDQME